MPINVDLEYGYYDSRRNVAYLTSGRFESLRWVHIRGEFSEAGNKFTGQYVQSVYGPIHGLLLEKIREKVMKSKRFASFFIVLCTIGLDANAMDISMVKGATLTEVGEYVFDAVSGDGEKTSAQKMIDRSFQ